MANNLALEYRPAKALVPYAKNARTHSDEQIDQIARSISKFGFTNPILTDGKNGVIAGHGRLLAAAKLGIVDVPVIELAGMTEAQKRAYIIADNKLALNAGWDTGILKLELAEISELGEDLSITGFSEDEIARLMGDKPGLTDPDDVPENVEPVSKLGDLWVLGNHRLICGDSTDALVVEKLLGSIKPHLMVTDPPYGIGYEYKDFKDKPEANEALVRAVFEFAPKGRIWTPGLMNLARELSIYPNAKVLVWHKGFAAAGNGLGGASTWEPVLVVEPPERSLDNDYLHFGTDRETIDGKSLRKFHSCPKPVALFSQLIRSLSKIKADVYEPFCGSGTTIIAGEMTGRHIYAIELNPAYVDVTVKRWENFTGQKAVLDGSSDQSEGLQVREAVAGRDHAGSPPRGNRRKDQAPRHLGAAVD